MPSTGSDRDREFESQSRPHEEPNFFIRFKNNVDSHISAVLQGILGLPSAFQRDEDDGRGPRRWKDLDEELKRRDELQARQRALKEAAASASKPAAKTGQDGQEVSIPVRIYRGHPGSWSGSDAIASSNDRKDSPTNGGADIDLYTPLTSSIFEHLALRKDESEEKFWDRNTPKTLSHVALQPLIGEVSIRDDQLQKAESDPLRIMQYMTYNLFRSFSTSTSNFTSNSLHIQFNNGKLTTSSPQGKSLVPYLLFSPYSPLALTDLPALPAAVRKQGTGKDDSGPVDVLTYCDAFQDLLLASQGRPMQSWRDQSKRQLSFLSDIVGRDIWPLPRLLSKDEGKPKKLTPLATAKLGMLYIRDSLAPAGLLTESPFEGILPVLQAIGIASSPFGSGLDSLFKSLTQQADGESSDGNEANTELEIYEHLKELTDVPPIDENSSEILSQVLAWRRDIESQRDDTRNEDREEASSDGNDNPRRRRSGHWRRSRSTSSASTQTDFPPSSPANPKKTVSVVQEQHSPAITATENEASIGSSRLVSTTTTTEHSVDKEGHVTSTVQVEKLYSDGRREVNRVVDFRPRGEAGKNLSLGSNNEKQVAETGDGKKIANENDEKKKKKGWFWGR